MAIWPCSLNRDYWGRRHSLPHFWEEEIKKKMQGNGAMNLEPTPDSNRRPFLTENALCPSLRKSLILISTAPHDPWV